MPQRFARVGVRASTAAGAVGLLGLILLLGCQALPSNKTRPAKSAEARAEAWQIDNDAYAKLGYRLDWRGFPAVSAGADPVEQLDVHGDVLLTLDRSSTLSALDASNGGMRWRNQVATPLTSFAGLGRIAGTAMAVSEGEVFAIDLETGNLTRRIKLGRVVNAEPAFVGTTLIYGTALGRIRAHDLVSGLELWANGPYGLNRPQGPVASRPALISGVVGVVSQTGDVSFHDPVNGATIGESRIGGGLATNPIAVRGVMVVASLDQSVYGFAPIGGQMLWRYRTSTPLRTQPGSYQDLALCTVPEEGLIAFEATTGVERWRAPEVEGTLVAVRQGRLIIWDGGKQFWALSSGSGDVLESVTLENISKVIADAPEDGNLYVVSNQGVLAKFTPRS